jgi:hypothetical protein
VGEPEPSEHRLQREIVASQLAGDLVNLMGAGFVHRVSRGGPPPAEVARAWLVAAELTGHARLMEELRMGRSDDAGGGDLPLASGALPGAGADHPVASFESRLRHPDGPRRRSKSIAAGSTASGLPSRTW